VDATYIQFNFNEWIFASPIKLILNPAIVIIFSYASNKLYFIHKVMLIIKKTKIIVTCDGTFTKSKDFY